MDLTNPIILLIPKKKKKKRKLRKRSKCNHNVDSHVISFLELYITLAKGLEIL